MQPAKLFLSDRVSYKGHIPKGQPDSLVGEVVFTTGMTGYIESLTDPSYAGQILVFTYPLIGNYGVMNSKKWESDGIHARGVVVNELCQGWNHSAAEQSLLNWLKKQKVPIITAVDTRALTKHLRVVGSLPGMISSKNPTKLDSLQTPTVSVRKPISYNWSHKKKIILVDCGLKNNILRSVLDLPAKVKRVPLDYDYTNENYDGVLISNGPGDPADYKPTISITKKAFNSGKPVFGICLGSQIMGLAAGAKTYKLKFGHRGHNQPCISTNGDKCYITSQNHGYAVDEKTIPAGWSVSFRNLNDNSVEGLEHQTKPFFSVQFHPEASPGPTDTRWLFEKFYAYL